MGKWSRIEDQAAFDAALKLCGGKYQEDLLCGHEAISGSTLKGRARNFGGKYRISRQAILGRMTAAGIAWRIEIQDHGRKVLVIG